MATIPLMDDVEYGGKNDEGIEDDFMYRNNVHSASVQIRLGFLRKVYSLLFVQLLLTTVIGFTLIAVEPAKLFVQENTWMITLGFISNIVILIALHIKRKETPINFILLAIFTVVEAYTIGVIVSFYDQYVVLQAFLLTVLVLGGLTAYTFQTKRDFSNLGIVLFSALIILIFGGLIQLFIRSTAFEFAISIFGAFIFALFIVYDTQNLMLRVSPEEYILATIELYLDIINLFLYILRALDAARR
uniref:Protein lifeguard 4 n=1 Tax=Lygus hesperus TaxID=30085 RepID=A0A0A9ZCR4_LYGHE